MSSWWIYFVMDFTKGCSASQDPLRGRLFMYRVSIFAMGDGEGSCEADIFCGLPPLQNWTHGI